MATPASTSTTKFYTRAEVATHKENRETWMIIHHNVYNVTGFLDEVRNIFIFKFYPVWIYYEILIRIFDDFFGFYII